MKMWGQKEEKNKQLQHSLSFYIISRFLCLNVFVTELLL